MVIEGRIVVKEMAPEQIAAFASLFVHCWQQYAVQQRDGSYWRVTEPFSLQDVAAHLAGRWTLGTYLLDRSSQCSFAVFDADRVDGLACLSCLAEELLGQGVPTLLEASRRGGHVWVHLVEPTPAQVVRAWLLPYAQAFSVEFYPKQDWLAPGGSGSLIRLPLGIHRLSRGWYPFVQHLAWGELVPVGETVADSCAWACQHVQRVVVPDVVRISCAEILSAQREHMMADGGNEGEVPSLMASHWEYEGYRSIQEWCRSQDIRAVIGRYVTLDQRGVGSCPFKEHHSRGDLRPSFQVFGGNDQHWYCYAWRRAGDLFDFLCLYYQLTPQEVWERVQQGALW
jgi:TOTE conflict system primase-like protein/CHC2-type zinc finger protein